MLLNVNINLLFIDKFIPNFNNEYPYCASQRLIERRDSRLNNEIPVLKMTGEIL